MVNKATIQLDNGKSLVINVVNQGTDNIYVDKIEINGTEFSGNTLKHSNIMQGGEITFYLNNKPKK